MTTRDQAAKAAINLLRAGEEYMLTAPLEDAVAAALTPTGPSADEVRRQILEYRGHAAEHKAAS